MIHEATFADNLKKNAKSCKHATIGEAIYLAHSAKVWRLILTHFSQRSCRIIVEEKDEAIQYRKEYSDYLMN